MVQERAVKQSVDQIRGAQRWLSKFPDRVFMDAKCTQRLPLELPPLAQRKTHGIVVALGAGRACRQFFKGGSGSFVINPQRKGDDHVGDSALPFVVGDVDPTGSFIHVFDDATLRIVMSEMDTITDFTTYLTKKESAIRSGHIGGALGEEDLLAYYATHTNPAGEHDFTRPDGSPLANRESLFIEEGHYTHLLNNPQYLARKRLDEDSYVWDRLIEAFTSNLLAGTNIAFGGFPRMEISEMEQALRHMVLVPRFRRRLMGAGILEALKIGQSKSRMTRGFLPGLEEADRETAFFFMTLAVPTFPLSGGYDQYREIRLFSLRTYALSLLRKYANLKRVIGIASEPLPQPDGLRGSSEDLIMVEAQEWSEEFIRELDEDQKTLGIFQEGNYQERQVREMEFPEVL